MSGTKDLGRNGQRLSFHQTTPRKELRPLFLFLFLFCQHSVSEESQVQLGVAEVQCNSILM